MSSGIKLWSCAAVCADQVAREVVGLYRGERSLLVSRPWCAPSGVPVLQIANRRLFPLLASLISVADYHAVDGAWYGEVAADWKAVATISGMSRNTIGTSLQELMSDGFIHYIPAWGRVTPALIRIFPYNVKTGLRVFQVEASWLRAFITSLEPRTALYEAQGEGKSVDFVPVAGPKRLTGLGLKIAQAPVFVPKFVPHEPQAGAHGADDEMFIHFIEQIEGVAGLEDVFNYWSGSAPRIRKLPRSTSPGLGLVEGTPQTDWRSESWSQNGIEIKVVDVEPLPIKSDIGVLASWEIASEDPAEDAVATRAQVQGSSDSDAIKSTAPRAQNLGSTDQEAVSQAEENAAATRALAQGSTGYTDYNERSDADHHNRLLVDCTSPTAGLVQSAGGAPAAPPAAAPPAANGPYLRRSSQRQLLPGQVAAIYELRGPRLSDQVRRSLTTRQISCIEIYERLIGVPFCEKDVPFLDRALTLTSHAYVLRGIRDCSRYPDHNPGYWIVREGMSSVFNYIEQNKKLHAVAKGKKTKIASGMTKGLAESVRARRRLSISKGQAVPPSTPATSPQAPSSQPQAGIVSETTPAVQVDQSVVSAASGKRGPIWPS